MGEPHSASVSGSGGTSIPSDVETMDLVSVPHAGRQRPIGPRLGRYLIIEEVGRGAMGAVVRAYDPRLCREVALKCVLDDGLEASEHRLRVMDEARAMAALSHPNVVSVFDVEELAVGVVISMEFVSGTTLQQWLQASRSWREVVRTLVEAGRGLGAAHEAGLVHRDFKPANVLVGEDGRARVTDFGLARLRGTKPRPTLRESGSARSHRDSRPITREGKVVGSPGYMAPEAMRGEDPNAPSDIYSFCVALYEGLHGTRPFRAKTFEELVEVKERGVPTEPQKNRAVPRAVHQVAMRGLRPDPDERWQTMAELVAGLESILGRRRRRVWQVTGLAALGMGAVAVAAVAQRPSPCEGGSERVEPVWSPNIAKAVAHQLEGNGVGFAGDISQRVETRIDEYAAGWVEQYAAACRATNVLQEQSPKLLDLRMRCLDGRLDELAAVVDVLRSADASTAERAAQAVEALPSLDACADTDALESGLPPPSDPEAVRVVRKELARVAALVRVGSGEKGLRQGEALWDAVEASGYPPLRSELLLQLAAAHRELAHDEEFFETAFEALNEARAVRHRDVAAQAAIAYAESLRAYADRGDELQRALRVAEAEVEASGSTERRINLLLTRGSVEFDQGKFAAAQRDFQAARQLQEGEPPSLTLAKTITNLANTRGAQGYPAESETLHKEALEMAVEVRGPLHPHVATAHQNLGGLYFKLGKLEQAEFHTREAIRIRGTASGVDHPMIPNLMGNLAAIQLTAGKLDEGIETLERALQASDAIVGPDSLDTANTLHNLVGAHYQAHNYDRARALMERYMKLVEPLGPGDPRFASALERKALLQDAVGDVEGALDTRRRRLQTLATSMGPDHLSTLDAMADTAMALRKVKRYEEALQLAVGARDRLGERVGDPVAARIQHVVCLSAVSTDEEELAIDACEKAVAIFDASNSQAEGALWTRFQLAQLLHERDPSRARGLLGRVAESVRETSKGNELRENFDRWLKSHAVELAGWPPPA